MQIPRPGSVNLPRRRWTQFIKQYSSGKNMRVTYFRSVLPENPLQGSAGLSFFKLQTCHSKQSTKCSKKTSPSAQIARKRNASPLNLKRPQQRQIRRLKQLNISTYKMVGPSAAGPRSVLIGRVTLQRGLINLIIQKHLSALSDNYFKGGHILSCVIVYKICKDYNFEVLIKKPKFEAFSGIPNTNFIQW